MRSRRFDKILVASVCRYYDNFRKTCPRKFMVGNAVLMTLNKLHEIYVEVRETGTWARQGRRQGGDGGVKTSPQLRSSAKL